MSEDILESAKRARANNLPVSADCRLLKLLFDWMPWPAHFGENFSLIIVECEKLKNIRLVDLDLDRRQHMAFPWLPSCILYFTRVGFDAKIKIIVIRASDKCQNIRLAGHENSLFPA